MEESFEYLDAPVERIAGADVPTPYAANLERLAFPQVCTSIEVTCYTRYYRFGNCLHLFYVAQVEDIVRAAKRTCYRSG